MAQFRPVDVSGLSQQIDILGRIKRRNRDREAAEKTDRLRNLGTVAGGILGASFASPGGGFAGAALGAQLGSTAGALVAERRGGEPVSNRELLSTGLSAAATGQQIQNQKQISTQNTQTNAAFAKSISTEGMSQDQQEQFQSFVLNEDNLTADPQRFRQGVLNINPELRKPQIFEVEGQRFVKFIDENGQRTSPIGQSPKQIADSKLTEEQRLAAADVTKKGGIVEAIATEQGVTFTEGESSTAAGQAAIMTRIKNKSGLDDLALSGRLLLERAKGREDIIKGLDFKEKEDQVVANFRLNEADKEAAKLEIKTTKETAETKELEELKGFAAASGIDTANFDLTKPEEIGRLRAAIDKIGKIDPLKQRAEVLTAQATENEVDISDLKIDTAGGQSVASARINKKVTDDKSNEVRLTALSTIISNLPEGSASRESAQSFVDAGKITPSELAEVQASAGKEQNFNTNTAIASTYDLELTPQQLNMEPRLFNDVVKNELKKKDETTSTQEQTANNTVYGELKASQIGDQKFKEEIGRIPTNIKSSVYQGKVGVVQSKYIDSFNKKVNTKVNAERNITKKAALARNASIELAEVSPSSSAKFAQLATRLEKTRDSQITKEAEKGQEFNKVLLKAEANANTTKIKTPFGNLVPLTKAEKAESIAQEIEPHTRLGSTPGQRKKFADEYSRQRAIFLTNRNTDITNETALSNRGVKDDKDGHEIRKNNTVRQIRKTQDLVSQMDQALADPTITTKDKDKIEKARTDIIDDVTDGVVEQINNTVTEEQANRVSAVMGQQFEGLLDQERILQALEAKVDQIPGVEQKTASNKIIPGTIKESVSRAVAPSKFLQELPKKEVVPTQPVAREGSQLAGAQSRFFQELGEKTASAQTNLTAPTDLPPVNTGNVATIQNTPPTSLTTLIDRSGNISFSNLATTRGTEQIVSRLRATVADINVSNDKIESLALSDKIELLRLMDDPDKNEAAIKKLLE